MVILLILLLQHLHVSCYFSITIKQKNKKYRVQDIQIVGDVEARIIIISAHQG